MKFTWCSASEHTTEDKTPENQTQKKSVSSLTSLEQNELQNCALMARLGSIAVCNPPALGRIYAGCETRGGVNFHSFNFYDPDTLEAARIEVDDYIPMKLDKKTKRLQSGILSTINHPG